MFECTPPPPALACGMPASAAGCGLRARRAAALERAALAEGEARHWASVADAWQAHYAQSIQSAAMNPRGAGATTEYANAACNPIAEYQAQLPLRMPPAFLGQLDARDVADAAAAAPAGGQDWATPPEPTSAPEVRLSL